MRLMNGFRIDADEASSGLLTGTEISRSLSANPGHTGALKWPVRVTIPDSHFHKFWWGHGWGHEQIAFPEPTDLTVF